MTEGKELPVTESPREIEHLTNKEGEWEVVHESGRKDCFTYFNKLTQQFLRVRDYPEDGSSNIDTELDIFRKSVTGLEELKDLIKIVDFDGKPAILSPNFGLTFPALILQAAEQGTRLPPSFFKRMIKNAQEMVERGVYKTFDKALRTDEHIVCYVVKGEICFAFLDPDAKESGFLENKETSKEFIELSIGRLAKEYYGYSAEEVSNAEDIELDDLKGLSLRDLTPVSLEDNAGF